MVNKVSTIFNNSRRSKKTMLLFSIFFGLLIVAGIKYSITKVAQVSADSLLKFDEGYGSTIGDQSGNISGAMAGASWRSDSMCFDGKCLYFDGAGDYINFGDDADLDFINTDKFTLMGWIRHSPISTNADYIIAKHQSGVAGGYKVYMDSDGDIVFAIDDDGTWDTTDIIGDDQSKNFDDNKWHHFAAVKNGTTGIYLYVDGILVDQDTSLSETNSLANSANFYIGIDADGSSNAWQGFMDEIKIYRSARTADEIKADYAASTTTQGVSASFGASKNSFLTDGLAGYWKLDSLEAGTSDPTVIEDASNLGTEYSVIVRTSNGTIYVFVNDGGECEIWKSTNGSSWTEQGTNPTCQASNPIDAAIDANGIIHLVYIDETNQQPNYNTFNTSTDAFGTEDDFFVQCVYYCSGLSIAIDSSNFPHVAYGYYDDAGQPVVTDIVYINKIDGMWNTPVLIASYASAAGISKIDITINEDDIAEAVYINPSNYLSGAVGDTNNATAFTTHNIDTTIGPNSPATAGIDSSGNTWVAYLDENGATDYPSIIKHNDADLWSTWQSTLTNNNAGTSPTLAIDGTDVYVIYADENSDIVYDKYTGTWTGETLLNTGTYNTPKFRYANYSNASYTTYGFDYLFNDTTDLYWTKIGGASGGAIDYSGGNINLSVEGTVTAVGAKFGKGSEHVPASSDYLASATTINAVQTVSFWANPDSTTNYYIALNSNAYITSSTGTLAATGFVNPKIYVNGIAGTTIAANQWSMVTVVTETAIDASQFYVGRQGSNYYDGTLDEIRLYSKALSPAEIRKLHGWGTDPAAYWKFDENNGSTAFDTSGNGNNASLINTTWNPGKLGAGVYLDPTRTSYADVSDNTVISLTGDFTLSAWIKPVQTTADTTFPIVGKGTAYNLNLYGDEVRLYIGSASNYVTTNAANLTPNNWYHITGIYNAASATAKIFVNGIESPSTVTGTIPGSITDGTENLYVGFFNDSSVGNFQTSVLNSTDDALVLGFNDNPVSLTDNELYFGKVGSVTETASGVRFTNVTVPKDANITAATFTATCIDNYSTGNPLSVKVAAEATDDAATFTTTGFNLSTATRPRTSYTSSWDLSSCTAEAPKSKDVTVQVQAIVDRAGWVSGNDLVLIIENDGSNNDEWQNMWSQNGSGQEPQIEIDYTTGASVYFSGVIDEVKMYDYIRSNSQLVEDMNGGHPTPGSPVGSAVFEMNFDEGYGDIAHDSSINAVHGSLAGTTACPQSGDSACPTWTTDGKINNGMDFEDSATTDDYILVPDAASLDIQNEITVSIWVKPESQPAAQFKTLIHKGNSTNTGNYYLALYEDEIVFGSYQASLVKTQSTNANIATGTWTHIAVTYTDATDDISMYVNGIRVQDDGLEHDMSISPNNDPLYVSSFANSGEYYDGVLDELKIYSSALTPESIKVLYNNASAQVMSSVSTSSTNTPSWSSRDSFCPPGQGGSCTAPVLYWNLDEYTGGKIYDKAGNNLAASFIGNPTWITGKKGSGLKFPESDSVYVESDANLTGSSNASMAFWMRSSDTSTTQVLVYWGGRFCRIGGVSANKINCGMDDGSSGSATSTTSVNDGKWHHIVITSTANSQNLYVDGILEGTATETLITSDATVMLGRSVSASFPYNGDLDEIKIFNYVLTPAQVAWDYSNGEPTVRYKLDECSGNTIYNSATNGNGESAGNHGTWTGNTTGTNTSIGSCSVVDTATAWYNGAAGKLSASLDFDGTNDIVTVPFNQNYDFTANLSVSFWFTPDATIDSGIASNLGLISKASSNTDTDNDWAFFWNTLDGGRMRFGTYGDNIATTNATWTAGTWYHITAVVTDTNTANVYVNGILNTYNSDTDLSTNPINGGTDTPLKIGMSQVSSGNLYFDGKIDDVRIYSYPLSEAQIKTIMNEGAVSFR